MKPRSLSHMQAARESMRVLKDREYQRGVVDGQKEATDRCVRCLRSWMNDRDHALIETLVDRIHRWSVNTPAGGVANTEPTP